MAIDDQIPATIRGLMHGYNVRWADDHTYEPIAVEQEFRVPIYNLEAKGTSKSRTFVLMGKLDVILMRYDKRWIMDHKTTSSDLGPDSTYWSQLSVEGQANTYILAQHYDGEEVAGAIWDSIRKPGIRPKALTKKDRAAVTCLGDYFGRRVSKETRDHAVASDRENAELFEARIASECTENGERYFQRHPIIKLQHELVEYAHELWDLTQELISVRRTKRHTRNGGACLDYGSPCKFLGICSGQDTPQGDRWVERESVHEELSTLEGDGRDVLTHSRLACFQTCKRKHYYKYELGIKRANEELAEPLYFGNLMHTSLEGWWNKRKEPTNGDSQPPTSSSESETSNILPEECSF